MRNTLAYTLSAAGLYAMVASCSTTVNGGDPVTSLAGMAGEWKVVDASEPALRGQMITIGADAMALPLPCEGVSALATVDRQGRMSMVDTAVFASAPASAGDCTPERDLAALVDARPRMVRVNDRTVDIRRGRQRVRIRKA